jgi:hypothetical protein
MQMNSLLFFALLSTAACTTAGPVRLNGIDVPIGQSAYVDGPVIRPTKIIEDSRCPANARCIWAGTVKIEALWVRADGNRILQLELGKPQSIADGTIELTDVSPSRMAGENKELKPADYRFSFRFMGGI